MLIPAHVASCSYPSTWHHTHIRPRGIMLISVHVASCAYPSTWHHVHIRPHGIMCISVHMASCSWYLHVPSCWPASRAPTHSIACASPCGICGQRLMSLPASRDRSHAMQAHAHGVRRIPSILASVLWGIHGGPGPWPGGLRALDCAVKLVAQYSSSSRPEDPRCGLPFEDLHLRNSLWVSSSRIG